MLIIILITNLISQVHFISLSSNYGGKIYIILYYINFLIFINLFIKLNLNFNYITFKSQIFKAIKPTFEFLIYFLHPKFHYYKII
jgi:hypothetical protein